LDGCDLCDTLLAEFRLRLDLLDERQLITTKVLLCLLVGWLVD
jgi:hypothetical protein